MFWAKFMVTIYGNNVHSCFQDLTLIIWIILPFKFHECPFFLKGYFEQLFSVSAAGKSGIILLPNFCMFSQMLLLFKLTIACWRIFFMAVQDDSISLNVSQPCWLIIDETIIRQKAKYFDLKLLIKYTKILYVLRISWILLF